MKKEYLKIGDKKVTAKDGIIEINGKPISEKDQILEKIEIDSTVLGFLKATQDNKLQFKSLRIKRGSSAKF